ncbi:MAG TPA: hypothetical protein VE982_02800 [Gaiellaceae bacterium]|nr:hypothetical protein [Gaiellaceae bacterium]
MSPNAVKGAVVAGAVAVAAVLIGLYVLFLTNGPTPYHVPVAQAASGKTANLTLQTVATIGPKEAPNQTWVSYLVREGGKWVRSTVWTLPAHSLIHVTIYNYDGNSGLRNPFLALGRGLVGGTFTVDGKPTRAINPDDASHTFAIPQLGLIVPLPGIADNAKNPCGVAPCDLSMAHHTVKFTFRTGKPGHYRWQCFVPCAAGFYYGFGGPMQTIGYMDGFVNVV